MEHVSIKEIINYDIEAQEADVLISDGQFEILCYAQPYLPETFKAPDHALSAFMTENVLRVSENEYRIKRLQNGYYSYRLQGKLIDLQKRLVMIGAIVIKIENVIPKDIREGDFIEFTVMRLDL